MTADEERRVARRPLVGRARELARLRELADGVARGRGGLAVVGGEPGVGKTRLVDEVAADAAQRGLLVLRGAAVEGDRSAYLPVVEIVEAAYRTLPGAGFRAALGPAAADLTRLLPELRRWVPDLAPAVELPAEQERRLLFGAFTEFLGGLGATDPVLLVLEDLHWSDAATMQLLLHVARRLPDLPVAVIATFRDTELEDSPVLPAALDRLRREGLADVLPLRRFDPSETAELLTGLGGDAPPVAVRDAIHRHTEGNAYFVEAMYQHLADRGLLFDGTGGWRDRLVLDDGDVPSGVRIVIGLRLRRLTHRTRTVLTALAVLGGPSVPCDLLVALAGVGAEAVFDALEEAERAHLVTTSAGGRRARAGFEHELVRHTLLAAVSAPRREHHHLRAAAAIASVYGARRAEHAADLVHHLLRAGDGADPAELYGWLVVAADRAIDGAAFEDAVRYVDAALGLTAPEDHRVHADLLGRKGRALRGVGRWDEALAAWRAGLARLRALGDGVAVGRECAGMAGDLLWAGRYPECVDAVEQGLAALGDTVNPDRVRLLSFGGRFAGFQGDWVEACRQTDEGLRVAEQLGDAAPLAVALLARTVHDWTWAEPASAIRHARCGIEAAHSAGSLWDLADGLGFAAFAHVLAGDLPEVTRLVAELEVLAARFGHDGAALVGGRNTLLVRIGAGDLDAVRAAGEADLRRCREANLPYAADAHVWLGLTDLWRGDWDEAARRFRTAMDTEIPSAVAGAGWAFAFLLRAYRGDTRTCRAMLAGAGSGFPSRAAPARLGRWTGLLTAVEGMAVLGLREQAAACYPLVEQALAAGNVLRGYDNRLVQAVAGVSAAAGRNWATAQTHFETALRQAHEIPMVLEQAEVRRLYAAMLVDRGGPGDRDRAEGLATEAVAAYRRIGMPEHVVMARALLDPTFAARAGAGADRRNGLTRREAEVLALIAGGATSKEVAATLVVSVATVYRHVANIYRKIGARNRAEATAYALRHGFGDATSA